jgi:hypothetical protein
MAKLATFIDAFTAAVINTTQWNSITGTTTLDTVNDLVTLAVPTVSGTTNSFGTTATYDATSSSIYAEIGTAPNGNGGTGTSLKISKDANNWAAIRLQAGVFAAVITTAGTSVPTTLATYDPNAHGWWRITESSGSFLFATSADGYNWTTLATLAYSWAATAVTVAFQTAATVTEVSGNTATIQHVNTMLGGPFNINWPIVEHGWGARWNANGGDSPLDRYADITQRTMGTVSISRGRQYELDQIRSGEASVTLANTDAALDPLNASGPFFGHIMPYQPYRIRAQWPPTRNLLTQVQATGGDLGGISAGTIPGGSSGIDVFTETDGTGGSIVASATAWQGGTVLQFSVPSGTAALKGICYSLQPAALRSGTYTLTMRVRNVTASTSLTVAPFAISMSAAPVNTRTNGTSTTLTGSTTAAWTTLTLTVTLGADAAGLFVGVEVATTAGATCSVQVDGWQLEKGATASNWACPGVWNPVYAGFMERWPSSWNMSGTYGKVEPSAVDAFSLLSQKQLSDPLTQEINNNSPRFLFKLNDPSGSTSVADATGTYPAAQLGVSKYGAGSLTFGNAITAADTTGTYTGSTGSVVRISNSNPGTNLITGGATFIKLGSAGILGPATPSGSWSRMFAFRYTGPVPTSLACLWSSFDNQRSGGAPSGSALYWYIGTDSKLYLAMRGPASGATVGFNPSATTVVDSDWHLVIASYSHANAQLQINFDGSTASWPSFDTTLEPTGLISDNVGGWVDPTVGNGTSWNFKGDMSYVAEFPSAISPTAMGNLYSAWKSACAGESSDARYARILRYSGYTGPSSVQTGLTTSMGPAAIDGQDTVSALQAIVDTEGGAHYVNRAGTVTFKSRSARYNATTPVYIFGENAPGEWPYEDVTLDYDSTHLSNQITVTQESTSQEFYAQDATSNTNYFPRTMTRTINSSSTLECQDAANYLLSRYKNPATRVSSIKLHPSANPALWPVCLALELGTRVRIMRRAPNVPAVQVECFVENIQWDYSDNGEAFQTLQCSPADLTPYGIFASWHTTLKTAISAGATSITINPSQDSTNILAAQLAVGEVLTLDPGTSVAENVTVTAVGATSSGWTSATITISAAVNAHSVGAVVCDQLPTGTTDATTWDTVSAFDAVTFSY